MSLTIALALVAAFVAGQVSAVFLMAGLRNGDDLVEPEPVRLETPRRGTVAAQHAARARIVASLN